jgi:hypothetical protein
VYVSVLQVFQNELTDLLTQPSLKQVSAHKKVPYLSEQLFTDEQYSSKSIYSVQVIGQVC